MTGGRIGAGVKMMGVDFVPLIRGLEMFVGAHPGGSRRLERTSPWTILGAIFAASLRDAGWPASAPRELRILQ
jgi:hypothetical protein